MNNFFYCLAGALFGYLTAAIAYFVHKHFKHAPKRPKKNVCMVIGHSGSGAFSHSQIELIAQRGYSEVLTRGHIQTVDEIIHGLFSLETPIDTFYLYGAIGRAEAEIWQDFLIRLPLKHSRKHPLSHYIPEYRDYISGTIIKLSRRGDHWRLQKLRMDDHKVIY